jgi:hypothetical protein
MKLQELIDASELDMEIDQIKAFFLGVLCAEKPMNFAKTLEELLSEVPEAKASLEGELKKLWDELQGNVVKGLQGS